MLQSGAVQTGIDGATMHAEDAENGNTVLKGQMDVRKMLAMIGAFYWVIMTVIVVPGAVVATFLAVMLPALIISVPLHNWIDHKMCRMVNDHWVATTQSTGLNIVEYGDDISKIADKRVLLLSNHLGLMDHFVLMTAAYNRGTIAEKYLWVIFNIWKWTPLGLMWLSHGNYFINGGASKRERILKEFKVHLKNNYWKYEHGWIVMYPEGSRLFLIKESSARFATRLGLKPLQHCALPRTGAAHAILDLAGKASDDDKMARCGLGGPIDYVVDCTIGYRKGEVPNLVNYMTGEIPQDDFFIGAHYKIYPAQAEWSDEEKLKEWLYERYQEKDKLLDNFYKTDTFPTRPRPIRFPLSRCVVVETFWTLLFYLHYWLWMKPLSLYLMNSFATVLQQLFT